MEALSIGNFTAILVFIGGIITCIIGVFSFSLSRRDKAEDKAREHGIIIGRLDSITASLAEITRIYERHEGQISNTEQRITVVEESTKSAHKRIDELNRKVG